MIRNWIEAIGDTSPVYSDAKFAAASVHGTLVTPPAMIQGLDHARAVRVDDELTLPAWREAGQPQAGNGSAERPAGDRPVLPQLADRDSGAAAGRALPELVIDVTPTFVVASAIATRDFQDVHHDRDRAVARGSKDVTYMRGLGSTCEL